jgi:hypothetical protein
MEDVNFVKKEPIDDEKLKKSFQHFIEENNNLKEFYEFMKTHQNKKHFYKFKDVTIMKKIKSRACKSITKMLNDYFQKLPNLSNLKNLKNLSHKFTRNTSKKLNWKFFDFSISDIYQYNFNNIMNKAKGKNKNISLDEKLLLNKKIISEIKEAHPNDKILNSKFKDLLNLYFNKSEYFKKDYFKIEKKEHKYYCNRYIELARGFLNFYFP